MKREGGGGRYQKKFENDSSLRTTGVVHENDARPVWWVFCIYKSNYSVVKKDSDRSALVNVKARPTDNPPPHTYSTFFIPMVWTYLLLLSTSVVITFVLKVGLLRLAVLRADVS